jgi:microcystin-dependent protein
MKQFFIFLVLTVVSITTLQAQVGFNNPNPHPNSLLDLTATDKGLLIPRLTTVQRDALTLVLNPAAESLLVYDTNLQGFYFFRAGTWYALNEWVKTAGSNNVSLTGNASISGSISSGSITNAGTLTTNSLTSTGNISAGTINSSGAISTSSTVSAAGLNVTGFSSNALVPTGAIMMWSGSIAAIPTGWVLCDGSSGRPDLRDRFIVGSGGTYSVGTTGGEAFHTLNTNEMPNHDHVMHGQGLIPGISTYLSRANGRYSGSGGDLLGGSGSPDTGMRTGFTGSSQPHENRPPYYALAYIIKL